MTLKTQDLSLNAQFPPFRADIVGSFLRPAELKEARSKFEKGIIDAAELTTVEDKYIRRLVEQQVAAGLSTITDGEYRRSYWHLDFFWGIGGCQHNTLPQGYLFHGEETRKDSVCLTGRVHFNPDHPHLKHFKYLVSIAPQGTVPRQDIPAPCQLYAELFRDTNALTVKQYYGDNLNLLVQDIADAYHQTILEFYRLGCRHLKIDDCTWGMLCDKELWDKIAGNNVDIEQVKSQYVDLNNRSLSGLPEDLIISTHVCRGNYHSTYACQGSYEPVADVLFAKENVSAFYLEFDDHRSGSFEPLRYVPENKRVVLGLITTKRGELEDKLSVISRIREAAKFIPLQNLCLSPQCGFASTEEGNILTEEEQWKKIALVQEIAKEVWG